MLLIHSLMKFEVQPCFDLKSTDQKKDGKKKESKKVLLEGKFSKLLFLNRSYVDCVYSVTFEIHHFYLKTFHNSTLMLINLLSDF